MHGTRDLAGNARRYHGGIKRLLTHLGHQIHIAAFGRVIHPRPKQLDLRALALHSLGRALDVGDLGGGQAYGVSFLLV
jgi:hypothetical protein